MVSRRDHLTGTLHICDSTLATPKVFPQVVCYSSVQPPSLVSLWPGLAFGRQAQRPSPGGYCPPPIGPVCACGRSTPNPDHPRALPHSLLALPSYNLHLQLPLPTACRAPSILYEVKYPLIRQAFLGPVNQHDPQPILLPTHPHSGFHTRLVAACLPH